MPQGSLAVVLVLSATLGFAGCAPAPPTDTYGADGGIEVNVVQGRDDRGARIVAIEITNHRDDEIDVTRAELSGAQLREPAVWDRGMILRPGLTVDLRVQLGAPTCPLADSLAPSVTVEFATTSGVERRVSGEPGQPSGVLTRIAGEDCLIEGVEGQAQISVRSVEYEPGAHQPAVLVIAVQPTELDGRVTLVAVTATVLLALVDPDGHYSQRYELGRVLERGGDSSDLRIALVPNRCDAHAVAEDKRGTFIPFEVTSDSGLAGTYFVRVPDEEKGKLYAFYADYCTID